MDGGTTAKPAPAAPPPPAASTFFEAIATAIPSPTLPLNRLSIKIHNAYFL